MYDNFNNLAFRSSSSPSTRGVLQRLWRLRGYFPGAARALPVVLLCTVLVALTK